MNTQLATVQTDVATLIDGFNYPSDKHPSLVYLAGLSVSSRRPITQSLNLIANMVSDGSDHKSFAWHLLRYQHTQLIRTTLADNHPAATANRHLAALRGVLKECWRLGYTTAEDYQRACDIKSVKGTQAKAAEKGRHIKTGEFAALLDACNDGTKAGVRDAAIIALGYLAGLRRAELAALQLADYDQDECTLIVKHGKGNKERVITLAEDGCDYLADWLEVRGPWAGALFCAVDKADQVILGQMTDQAIYYILQRRIDAAGVKSFTPHDLRRTFAGDLLDNGADISTVQKLMGHSNANTTAGYDRRDAKAKRKATNTLHLPRRKG